MLARYVRLGFFVFSSLCIYSSYAKMYEGSENRECFDHNIQLQLYDVYGVPVPKTEFWVTIKVLKENNKVTLQFPAINFQTGQYANNLYEPNCNPFTPIFFPSTGLFPPQKKCPAPGGYLYTSDGYLPKHIRPTDIINRSFSVPSNKGNNTSFSFEQVPNDLPKPPAGYILQVTNEGAIVIQCEGTFGNVIPAGNQNLLPTDVSYIVVPITELECNKVLSTGPTNTTQFTSFIGQVVGVRDSHINDAYDGVAAWTWVDNSTERDKTNNILNVMVAIGKTDKDGKLKVRKSIQLTHLKPPLYALYDTAVAINRKNKNNIVVSYCVLNLANPNESLLAYRAVSFDGGKTWPHNGPSNIKTTSMGLGDNPGVTSDEFGHIWYVLSNAANAKGTMISDQPLFWVSLDGGIKYKEVAKLPRPKPGTHYGNVIYCLSGNGLWFTTVIFEETFPYPGSSIIGFIPIYGKNKFGPLQSYDLTSKFLNINMSPSIAASLDGRAWLYGHPDSYAGGTSPAPASGISTERIIYKSPGPIDQNYAGPWDFATTSYLNHSIVLPTDDSQPVYGYYNFSRTMLYDDKRQGLYVTTIQHSANFSQNMRLHLAISRDNGQSWSSPIEISNSNMGNRGFQSLALDSVTGDLYFGWYDGRNDPTFKSLEYYAAVLPAKQLDALVAKIPLSNPIYQIPQTQTNCPTCHMDDKTIKEQTELRNKVASGRMGGMGWRQAINQARNAAQGNPSDSKSQKIDQVAKKLGSLKKLNNKKNR